MIDVLFVGLYSGPGARGGIVHFNKLLIKNLDHKKFNTSYFSLGKSPTWYTGDDQPSTLKYYVLHIHRIYNFLFECKKKKIDIVTINTNLNCGSLFRDGIFSLIAKLIGCKTCLLIHGWDNKEYKTILKRPMKKFYFSRLLKKQDSISVLSQKFKDKLILFDINPKKIFLFSTMVEVDKYISKKKPVNNKQMKILFCAHPLSKKKGIIDFLNAIPLVLQHYPTITCIILGAGDELDDLKERAKKFNIKDHVDFRGFVEGDDKIKIFQESDILVFPSYSEGMPSTILEAMAAGLSIISTPVGGISNIIEDKTHGLIIKSMPPDPQEIADKIIQLLHNPEKMDKIRKINTTLAREKFDVCHVVPILEDIYESILRGT